MPEITLSERELREYHLGAALLERSGLAWEISDQLRQDFPEDAVYHGGLLVPYALRAGLDTATATKGAELKFQEPKPFIEALRAKAVLLRLGAVVLDGLVGDVKVPRVTAAATPGWKTENSGVDEADSNLLLDQAALTPKEAIGTTSYSRQLLAQSRAATAVDRLVQDDLAKAHAVLLDAAGINGTGASGQPTGILSAAGVDTTTIAGGVNGAAVTWANITGLERVASLANAEQKFADARDGTEAYLMPPGQRDKLRNKDRSGGTTGWMVITDNNEINGYTIGCTTNVPANLSKGTSVGICSAIIFGRISEVVFGFWDALELVSDAFTKKKQGMVEVTSYQLFSCTVRHGASFAAMVDAL